MRSSTKFILLLLSTVTLVIVTESQRTTLKEKKELEKLLNQINKPAIKSFRTEHGYILDCIDIHKQHAFDHPLLKNHSIQLKPTSIPKWTRNNNTSQESSPLPFQQDGDITCPLGTVIVKRTTLEDLIQLQHLKSLGYATSKAEKILDLTGRYFAQAQYYKDNYGAIGNINIWDPQMKELDQYSLASVSISNGHLDELQSISAGWIVSPRQNHNHSSLFIFWTNDGYVKTNCFNMLCPGFVQVSRKFALGAIAKPVSTYNGRQYNLEVSIFLDNMTGDWWFELMKEGIGYWPKSLFNVQGLGYGGGEVSWGGEVFTDVRQEISPLMGSGHFPQEGYQKAAYVNGLQVIERHPWKITPPRMKDLTFFANDPNCYKVETKSDYIYFGGPGGCTIK